MVVNTDGSGQREWSKNAFSIVGSPASSYFAVLTSQSDSQEEYSKTVALEIVHLPEMSVKTIPLMASPVIKTFDYSLLPYIHTEIYTEEEVVIRLINIAIVSEPPAWSPNGRYLAFSAAIDGPTADLYVYDTVSDQIRRLTDGLDMATQPEWSPDGKWIVHRGITGWGGGCYESGVWAAAVDGSEVKWLNRGECFEITRWVGPETFETSVQGVNGGYYGPERRIDISAGTSIILAPYELGKKDYTDAMHDCVTWKKLTPPRPYNGTRIDSPDQKWFVVIKDGLHLFASDGKLIAEFKKWEYFSGWQPDSSAIVFTSQGERYDQMLIYYYRPVDRTLKIFVKEDDNDAYGQVIWDTRSSSFFIQVGRTPELDYIDPLKGQILQVSGGLDEILPGQFTWVGAPTTVSKSVSTITRVNCYYDR